MVYIYRLKSSFLCLSIFLFLSCTFFLFASDASLACIALRYVDSTLKFESFLSTERSSQLSTFLQESKMNSFWNAISDSCVLVLRWKVSIDSVVSCICWFCTIRCNGRILWFLLDVCNNKYNLFHNEHF